MMLQPSFLSTKVSRRRFFVGASALAIAALFAKESMLSDRNVDPDLLASLEKGLLYWLRHYESDVQAILVYNSLESVRADSMRAAFRRLSGRPESLPQLLSMFIQDGASVVDLSNEGVAAFGVSVFSPSLWLTVHRLNLTSAKVSKREITALESGAIESVASVRDARARLFYIENVAASLPSGIASSALMRAFTESVLLLPRHVAASYVESLARSLTVNGHDAASFARHLPGDIVNDRARLWARLPLGSGTLTSETMKNLFEAEAMEHVIPVALECEQSGLADEPLRSQLLAHCFDKLSRSKVFYGYGLEKTIARLHYVAEPPLDAALDCFGRCRRLVDTPLELATSVHLLLSQDGEQIGSSGGIVEQYLAELFNSVSGVSLEEAVIICLASNPSHHELIERCLSTKASTVASMINKSFTVYRSSFESGRDDPRSAPDLADAWKASCAMSGRLLRNRDERLQMANRISRADLRTKTTAFASRHHTYLVP